MKLARLVAIGALLMTPGCVRAKKMVQVDESFNGREVVLHVGDTLEVKLSENATTGHKWSVLPQPDGELNKILRDGEQRVEAVDKPPGSPGVRYIDFEAIGTGSARLELQYRRVWEKDAAPGRRFGLSVRVLPSADR